MGNLELTETMVSKAKNKQALPEGWREVRLGDTGKIITGTTPPTNEIRYYKNGTYPFVTPTDIGFRRTITKTERYLTNDGVAKGRLIPKRSLLVTCIASIGKNVIVEQDSSCNQQINAIVPNKNYSVEYLYYLMENKSRYLVKFAGKSATLIINKKTFSNLDFSIPPLPEQKAISSLLGKWDIAIEKTEALIEAKEKQFKSLITSLISKTNYPRISVSSFTSEISNRNRDNKIERVLSVTNRRGFVLPEEQFERRVASANLSNYKIVVKEQYAYNPSRINVGSIARLDDYDVGVLSPMYVIFKLNKEKVNSDYFLHWLSSGEAKQRIRNSAQGSVRETVGFSDLGSILVPLPSMEKQMSIANTLNTAQDEIDILKQLAEQYRTQKRGLMRKLLTGKWTVHKEVVYEH